MSYTIHITEAADHLLDEADVVIGSLPDFPNRIQLAGDPFLSALGIRAVSVNHCLAFFRVSEAEKRDWIPILKLDNP